MSYKRINIDGRYEEFINVVDSSLTNPTPITVIVAQYWIDEANHLWKITRNQNGEETKTDLGIIN